MINPQRMRKPTEEGIKNGYVNSRGGASPQDHEIDLSDIPEMKVPKLIHRGPFSE
jgi:hypothetical protein